MNQTVYTHVIRRFLTVYGAPKVPAPDELFAEFSKALKDFSSAIIEPAIDRVIADHAYPTWPTVGEVVKAARAQAERNHRPTVSVAEPPRPPLTNEQRERANQIHQLAVKALQAASLEELQRRCAKPIDVSRTEFERRDAERAKRMSGGGA